MPDPAFIVEGVMEQRIVQRLCPGTKVVRTGCNGDDVPMQTMAKFIWQQIRLMNNKYYPIIILMDRERRDETCAELSASLRKNLAECGASPDQLIISFVDRSIENWILCDTDNIECQHGNLRRPFEFREGHTKGTLESLLPEGILYHETTVGVSLFCGANVQKLYAKSPSFRIFADLANISCKWLTPCRALLPAS